MTTLGAELDEDLCRWLDAATNGLPAELRAMVCGEIEAHYEDAVREHRARGKSAAEAHRAAMLELGEADATGYTSCVATMIELMF